MRTLLFLMMLLLASTLALAAPQVGAPAPDFAVSDAQGNMHRLTDYRGEILVLEWYNKDCPYVRKHYDSDNMQGLQRDMAEQGVKWLTVISSAPGKQGHQGAEDTLANAEAEQASPEAVLRDESGDMGRAYGAKTTPHMYVIDAQGLLRYMGAIDSNDSANPATITTAENYLRPAVDSVLAGEEVATKSSRPYGCSVKY